MDRRHWAFCAVCCVAALCWLGQPVGAQIDYPLKGQSFARRPIPALEGSSRLTINATALLERALTLQIHDNSYQAIWWLILKWEDPSAAESVLTRTSDVINGGTECTKPCDSSGTDITGCCDDVWLPHMETPNLVSVDEEQPIRYRIHANPTTGIVTWSTRIVGKWYAPLDFRAYPFDHQHLLFEVSVADSEAQNVGLRWEHVAQLNNTAHTKGADLSGWEIKWSKGKLYDSRACNIEHETISPRYLYDGNGGMQYSPVTMADRYFPKNHGASAAATAEQCNWWPNTYDEAQALYGPIVLVADIMIKRMPAPYVLSNLLPVILVSLVVLSVFFLPSDALADRLSMVMTAFLSIAALQFMFDFPPASYMNAMQQLVLTSYVQLALVAAICLLVHRVITVSHSRNNKRIILRKYNSLLNRPRRAGPGGLRTSATTKGSGVLPDEDGLDARGLSRGRLSRSLKSLFSVGPTARALRHQRTSGVVRFKDTEAEEGKQQQQQQAGAAEAAAQKLPPGPVAEGKESLVTATAAAPVPVAEAAEAALLPKGSVPGGASTGPASAVHPSSPFAAADRIVVDMRPLSSDGTGQVLGQGQAPRASPSSVQRPPHSAASEPSVAGTPFGSRPAHLQYRSPSRTSRTTYMASEYDYSGTDIDALRMQSVAASSDGDSMIDPDTAGFENRQSVAGEGKDAADEEGDGGSSSGAAAPAKGGWGWFTQCFSCRALGAVWHMILQFLRSPRVFAQHCSNDPDFAVFVASRIDMWSFCILFALYIIALALIIYINTQVGDHRLMIGSRPGNM